MIQTLKVYGIILYYRNTHKIYIYIYKSHIDNYLQFCLYVFLYTNTRIYNGTAQYKNANCLSSLLSSAHPPPLSGPVDRGSGSRLPSLAVKGDSGVFVVRGEQWRT